MPKALKWGILDICTLFIYQDIPKKKIQVTIFLSGLDIRFWNESYADISKW